MKKPLSTVRKLLYGLVTVLGVWFMVEMGLRFVMGRPPAGLDAITRTTQCKVIRHEQESWMECGQPEDRVKIGPKTKPRVVVLGGSSVRDPFKADPYDNFPEHLGKLLPSVEVINMGKAGLSMSGVVWLASQLQELSPDLVIMYEGHNDYAQTVFRGQITGTRLWMIPLLQVLQKSWVYMGLTAETRGVEAKAHPVPTHPNGPPPPAVCQQVPRSKRRGLLLVTDDTALKVRDQITSRFESDLRTAIEVSPAPVIVSTLMRNFEYPPSGSVGDPDGACAEATNCLQNENMSDFSFLEAYANQVCPDTSISRWVHARALAQQGKVDDARAAWVASLDTDPLPLRAPYVADEVIRKVAAETGATLLDLEPIIGPLPPGKLFTDTLHPSTEGAELIAQSLRPLVQEKLGI